MSPRRASVPLLLLAPFVVVALAATPARAASGSVKDPAHESSSTPAYEDLTGLRVDNTAATFRATLHLRKAVHGWTDASVVLVPHRGQTESEFEVGTDGDGDGSDHAFFRRYDRDGTKKVRCRGLRVVLDQDTRVVRVSFPQTCLGDSAGRLSVQARAQYLGDVVDTTKYVTLKRG